MVHFPCGAQTFGQGLALDQCAPASRAPVGLRRFRENCVALAANPFHIAQHIAEAPIDVTHASLVSVSLILAFPYTGTMHPPVRLVAIDMDGTLLPAASQNISPRTGRALLAVQQAGITVAIATGRRAAYTRPLIDGLGLRADMPLITSNGTVTCTLGGDAIDSCHLSARVARGICGVIRPFGTMVFTFDRPGRGELVVEDLSQAHDRIALWVEANRNAIEVVKPIELALQDGNDPIQGMAAGTIEKMRAAEKALKAGEWAQDCESVRTEYPARDLTILDLLPLGISKGWALERLAARLGVDRKETMAIGDNWNDIAMLEWAGQGIMMGNAAPELRTMAKMRGWKQAPTSDQDGVAVILERMLEKMRVKA